MATRGLIGILNADDTVTVSFCRTDCYIGESTVSEGLLNGYNSEAQAHKLSEWGWMPVLRHTWAELEAEREEWLERDDTLAELLKGPALDRDGITYGGCHTEDYATLLENARRGIIEGLFVWVPEDLADRFSGKAGWHVQDTYASRPTYPTPVPLTQMEAETGIRRLARITVEAFEDVLKETWRSWKGWETPEEARRLWESFKPDALREEGVGARIADTEFEHTYIAHLDSYARYF